MTRLDLDAISEMVELLGRKIDAPTNILPTFGWSDEYARPHVEVSNLYHYVVRERGQEIRRWKTVELDLLLFWIFADVTFQMACEYEVSHRQLGEDSGRQRFAKQEELMARLSRSWVLKLASEHHDTLLRSRFNDR
ncbi:Imm63 family immunity protein [Bosea sp. (in: a-proteobacteria)]|uniref:Imm63 family immunity protein n=1 Tax=Bosea sp. (in: a-proteobacteria) TaxID=1871050 RepID=UPI002B4839B6|nr:Imm63 family immunity protein [Bosea sp. (in: a-proteobacteria)]WRH55917.1 MAG: Imm63 family immunity protein [Bosea sp. (in: a-proteobacteria)]